PPVTASSSSGVNSLGVCSFDLVIFSSFLCVVLTAIDPLHRGHVEIAKLTAQPARLCRARDGRLARSRGPVPCTEPSSARSLLGSRPSSRPPTPQRAEVPSA